MTSPELRRKKHKLLDESRAIIDAAEKAGRGITYEERRSFDEKYGEITRLNGEITNAEKRDELSRIEAEKAFDMKAGKNASGPTFRTIGGDGHEYRSVRHDESFRTAAGITETSELNIGRLCMASITGDPRHLNSEERTMYSQGTSTSGGYLLSPAQSAMVIDLLRAKSIMSLAGAQTIPLTTEETRLAMVTADPTAYWTSEGDLITESEGTFGALVLYSKALAVYSEVSLELLRNAANAEQVISDTITAALATGLDAACLSGSGVGRPTGLLNATDQVSASNVGGPFTYDALLTRMGTLWGYNCESNTLLVPPALRTYIAKLKDGEGLPLILPPEVAKLKQFTSSQITSNDAYPVCYVGDFSNTIIGIRSGIEIEVSGTSGTVFQRKKVAIRGLLFADFNAGPINRIIKMHGITGT